MADDSRPFGEISESYWKRPGYDYSTWPPTKIYKQPKLTYTGEGLAGYACIRVEGSDDPVWIDAPEDTIKRLVDCWNLVRENFDGDTKEIQAQLNTWENERQFIDPWDSRRKPHP